MTAQNALFLLLLVMAVGFFSYNVERLVQYLRIGRAERRTDRPLMRLRNLFMIGIAQSKILRDPVAGPMHALIFWGFVVLTAGTVEVLIEGIWSPFTYALILPGPLYTFYAFSQDVFALLVLGAVVFAFYRRLLVRPRRLQGDDLEHFDALLILGMIAVLMVTLLVTAALHEVLQPGSNAPAKVISRALGVALAPLGPEVAAGGFAASWWIHAVLILVFLNYLPYSKHLHIVTSLPNVFLSNTSGPGQVGVLRAMDLESDAEVFGAADVEHLSWKHLLDGYSCTECGRCTAACPANITGKVLSPRKIVVNVRQRLMEKGPLLTGDLPELASPALVHGEGSDSGAASGLAVMKRRLLDDFITEEELWQCTSCRACVVECPVAIDQLDVIMEMRRNLVLTESRFPPEVQPAFESMERHGSPWAFSAADRGAWAAGLDVPTVAELAERGERPDVLFWVGCMGSFDDRAKRITVAFARIMQAAGITFAILGQEEQCNGDPARRMGNEYLWQMLATANVETLNRYRTRTIVTICPHCFHQIGNEYPQLGGEYEVIHHATFIQRLLEDGRIPLERGGDGSTRITFHDSCYLGRYNGIYDAPRETLTRSLPIAELIEMPRSRDRGLCCGAGGGRMFMEERQGRRINVERTAEALATGADSIATSCPFCMTMFVDGLKAKNSEVPVVDIAEVVASRLAVAG